MLWAIVFILVVWQPLLACTQTIISLDGKDWQLHNSAQNISISATVPGYVHLDLQAANVIADPYYGQFPQFHTCSNLIADKV